MLLAETRLSRDHYIWIISKCVAAGFVRRWQYASLSFLLMHTSLMSKRFSLRVKFLASGGLFTSTPSLHHRPELITTVEQDQIRSTYSFASHCIACTIIQSKYKTSRRITDCLKEDGIHEAKSANTVAEPSQGRSSLSGNAVSTPHGIQTSWHHRGAETSTHR